MSKSELYTCIVESINSSESFHSMAANENKKHELYMEHMEISQPTHCLFEGRMQGKETVQKHIPCHMSKLSNTLLSYKRVTMNSLMAQTLQHFVFSQLNLNYHSE